MKKTAKKTTEEVVIQKIQKGRVTIYLKGTSPLIVRRLALKGMKELLFPAGRKTQAQKATSLKHDPFEEYRESPYTTDDPQAPTLIVLPSTCPKAALMSAAIDIPGSTKAAIGRLAIVCDDYIPVWGVPKLKMDVVRMADINKTPDVRTRVCIEEWCTVLTVQFTRPMLNQDAIVNLMAGAGLTQGFGDYRIQKGKGNYGGFELCEPDDKDFLRIQKEGGRKAQVDAMRDPEPYDAETAELLSWFVSEAERREIKISKEAI